MKMITAVVRTTSLPRVVETLGKMGVRELCVTEVKVMGDHLETAGSFEPRNRIEIILEDDKAEIVANAITDLVHTGMHGDGVVAVCALDYIIQMRAGGPKRC